MRVATPNDTKLSDSGPGAGAVSTAARGEGAGCAWASWQAAQPVTEPVGLQPPPLLGTDMTAVRCSAWLGVGRSTANSFRPACVRAMPSLWLGVWLDSAETC